jgi:hypothetical protein
MLETMKRVDADAPEVMASAEVESWSAEVPMAARILFGSDTKIKDVFWRGMTHRPFCSYTVTW